MKKGILGSRFNKVGSGYSPFCSYLRADDQTCDTSSTLWQSTTALVPLARRSFPHQDDRMKRVGLSMLLTAVMLEPSITSAEVSFTGSYSRAEITEEETHESEGLGITYPANQGDILEYLLPLISQHRGMRSRAVQEETSVIREVVAEQEDQVAKVVKSLLSRKELSDSFSANYEAAVAELASVIDGWETWSGDFSQIHFYNRATGAPFWNEKTKFLDFGETRYSSQEGNGMNLAILPPFIARFGAGVDKLKIDVDDVEGFRWDIGLYAAPGISAKATSDAIAKLFPVLSNLQHEVAKQIGAQWIRNYLIERMLQQEIETTYFNGSEDNSHLVHGLARLYLFGFLNQVESNRMRVLLPNLMHFPLPANSQQKHLALVETLNPLEPITPEMETAANRVVMYGLLKASQQIEDDFFPLQFLQKKEIPVPKGGFGPESFAVAIRTAYPYLDETFAGAAHEIATLMRTNFLANEPDTSAGKEKPGKSAFPESYQKKTYGNLSITAPPSLLEATDVLGPTWQEGLEKTSQILQKRFDRKPVPAIAFGEKDYVGLRCYGIPAKESDVELWLLQTAVSNNVEQAFFHLFDGNEIEIWFKEDLVESLEESGDTETFSWNPSTKEISANFSFAIPAELFRNAPVEDLLSRYGELKSPAFPIVIVDPEIAEGTLEKKVAAIRNGDYVVEQIIAGAEELSPGELTGTPFGLMDETETFFVVVHEVVEGFLIKEVIASVDRRWFCDGLANWIAMRECDRRFGEGTGRKVMSKMFPPNVSKSLAEHVDLLAWPAVENTDEDLAAAKGLGSAHYDFATRAMEEALSERDPDFIRKWIEKTRETKWIRTNATTVIDAYDHLTGADLKSILQGITR